MITCYFENDKKKAFLRQVTVGALIIKDNKILLTKRAENLLEGGKYCYPGGYLSRDETSVQGVLREVKEETGYEAKVINLFRINDNPVRGKEDGQNVNFVYLVEPLEKISDSDKEVSEIKWFDLNNLPAQDQVAFDHYEDIELFKKYQQEKFKLPILPTK